jgi:DNA-binding IclR family transcriptional regulator
MQLDNHKYQILRILGDNLKNPQPQVVDSENIANKLRIPVSETKSLLRVLEQDGAVVTNLEGQYSLITSMGLVLLQEKNMFL